MINGKEVEASITACPSLIASAFAHDLRAVKIAKEMAELGGKTQEVTKLNGGLIFSVHPPETEGSEL